MANASRRRQRVRGINSRIEDLRFRGKDFRASVSDSLTEEPVLTRTIDGASSIPISLHDANGDLLRSKLMERAFDVELDRIMFRLAGVSKNGDDLTLTFEDRIVSYLRRKKGPEKAYRDRVTRAEFALSLVKSIKAERIRTVIKQLHKEQPIESASGARRAEIEVTDKRGKGLDRGANLTVKGVPADPEQIKIGDTALRVGESTGAPAAAQVACIAALIQESLMRNLTSGHSSSVGVLQLLSMHGSVAFRRDVARVCNLFYTKGFTGAGGANSIAKRTSDPAAIAATVQGNAAGASDYQPWVGEAKNWVEAFHGGGIGGLSGSLSVEVEERYAFEIEKGESYWDGIGRLAEEVQHQRFASANIFYYGSEVDFAAGRPLMRIGRREEGIDNVDFDWDTGLPVTEATITGRARAWACPPGTCCVLTKDYGPAEGRYIVSSVESGLYSDNFSATLKKPMKELPEPAPETTTATVAFGETGSGGSGGGGDMGSIKLDGRWGGTQAIFEQFVHPFMRSRGLSPGSQKRPYNTGSGTSDHFTGSTNAYATDYPTTNGEGAARALAKAMGYGGWSENSYDSFNIKVDGRSFRVQILWGANIDHDDHVHVGIKAL